MLSDIEQIKVLEGLATNKIFSEEVKKTNKTKKVLKKKNRNKLLKNRFRRGREEFNLDSSFSGKL